jgi:predicted metalloprotease
MSFRRGARLDPGQVRDVRGSRGAIALGGGGIATVVLAVVVMLMGGDPTALLTGEGVTTGAPAPGAGSQVESCQTGADANARADCRIVGYVNSIQAYWSEAYPGNGGYRQAPTTLFSQAVSTRCGNASSATGPFYCPVDESIYLDLTFFTELERRFGAKGGDFAEAYVVAHEYGHHIQNLLGVLGGANTRDTGADSAAVRVELMADCLAGVWAHNAESTGFLEPLTRDDIGEALSAAAAVGDDRIQESTQGRVNPESWTHGSAEQRQRWFLTGWEQGNAQSCDTFAVATP